MLTASPISESDLDKISRLDSYEQLNDVKFEGFSSSERPKTKSDKGTNTLNRRTVAVRDCRARVTLMNTFSMPIVQHSGC